MTRKRSIIRIQRWIAAGATACVLAAAPASAIVVTQCGSTCESDCELGNDLTCGENESAITLTNGADLDLNGFDINCEAQNYLWHGLCGVAVEMTAGNSVITGAADSYITGSWTTPIDCAGYQGSRVQGVKIQGYWIFAGIDGCQFVEDNVVQGLVQPVTGGIPGAFDSPQHPAVGIYHVPIGNDDLIASNYVGGCHTGIGTAPSASIVTIDDNTVSAPRLFLGLPSYAGGIDILNPNPNLNPAVVTNNLILGSSTSPIRAHANATVTYGNNVCGAGMAGCGSCVTSGYCVAVGTVPSG